jgi:spoIIIJ-associated protein
MEEDVEVSAKTVDEAIEKGLAQLGLERDQVRVEILSPGRAGLFGIGSDDVRVRLVPLGAVSPERPPPLAVPPSVPPAPIPEDATPHVERAVAYLQELLRLIDIEAEVQSRAPETPGDGQGRASAVLDVTGDDLAILIGRRGATLAAIQYLLNVIGNRESEGDFLVTLDVQGYRRRREEALLGLARRLADRVRQSGRPVTLEPMPSSERRIVHMALGDEHGISTYSVGEGEDRKVVIAPSRPPQSGAPGQPQ